MNPQSNYTNTLNVDDNVIKNFNILAVWTSYILDDSNNIIIIFVSS